jgi:8-oxo-dGTP pyrophosphatase MutT (NUDIX family)
VWGVAAILLATILAVLAPPLPQEYAGLRTAGPYAGGKVARYFLAETQVEAITLPVSPELGRPEHHEWRWVSFDEAEELLPPRLGLVLEWARQTLS